MKIIKWFQRPVNLSLSLILAGTGLLPLFFGGAAMAVSYGQVQHRTIEMSSSVPGAAASYLISFNAQTASTVQGMVVDFCSNDPIITDTCTAPTGFTVGTTPTIGTVTTTGQTGLTWAAANGNTGRTLELTSTGTVGGSVASGGNINFTLNTATNPTATNTTFYARIFTFATSGAVATWMGTANGSSTTGVVDAGGVALSTTAQITVTAKVQEQLSFCVYTLGTCASGGSSVTLGNTQGVLSSTTAYVNDSTNYDISTNAATGAVVRLEGGTLCDGTQSANGATCSGPIIAAAGTSSTPAASAPGSAQFGICTSATGSSTITPVQNYNGTNTASPGTTCSGVTAPSTTNGALFLLNTTATTGAYGDPIANVVAGNTSTGNVTFVGNIPVAQTAGIYTTTLDFIATGTY